MEGWWRIGISLIRCKFHGDDLWSCLLSHISISPLLNALQLLIRGMLKYGNTLGTISLCLNRRLGMPCNSTWRKSTFYVSKSKRQPHSFQTEITCEMCLNLELQPRFSKEHKKRKCFSELFLFQCQQQFFFSCWFSSGTKIFRHDRNLERLISHELIPKYFPKYVWGLKLPLLNFEVFCGPFLAFCQSSFCFRKSNLPVFGKFLSFSVARTSFPEVVRNFLEWFICKIFFSNR